MRVGMGYDVHKLVEGRKLIIGGVNIPYEKGLLGHSDADVLLHAIMDALLGAAALGDIFTYCVTSVQLALAFPSPEGGVFASAIKVLGVFAPTQLPLAIIEGILTVIIMIGLEVYAQPELKAIETKKEEA